MWKICLFFYILIDLHGFEKEKNPLSLQVLEPFTMTIFFFCWTACCILFALADKTWLIFFFEIDSDRLRLRCFDTIRRLNKFCLPKFNSLRVDRSLNSDTKCILPRIFLFEETFFIILKYSAIYEIFLRYFIYEDFLSVSYTHLTLPTKA